MEPILIAEIWIFMSFSKIIDGSRYLSNTLIFYTNHGYSEKSLKFSPKNKNRTQNKNHKLKLSRKKSK